MSVTVELFYSSTCPHCPEAKRTLTEVFDRIDAEIHFEEVNVLTPDGIKRAEEYGVMAVPTTIINTRHKIVGVSTKDRLLKVINGEVEKRQTGSERP